MFSLQMNNWPTWTAQDFSLCCALIPFYHRTTESARSCITSVNSQTPVAANK